MNGIGKLRNRGYRGFCLFLIIKITIRYQKKFCKKIFINHPVINNNVEHFIFLIEEEKHKFKIKLIYPDNQAGSRHFVSAN